MVVASVAGAKYSTAILWTVLLGAIMKFTMNEGLARWQLATGTTLLEGWGQRLPKFVSIYYFIYLLLWTFVVAAALIAGTGLAAHALTGLFGVAVMIISAGLNHDTVTGPRMAQVIAARLESVVGPLGKWCFLTGFRSAVFSSMLGVWQGVPYLFADFVGQSSQREPQPCAISTRSRSYRGYLLYITVPPMILLLAGKPAWLVPVYAVTGAFFMPLPGILLLFMNNRRDWLGGLHNGTAANLLLLVTVLVFGLLLYDTLRQNIG